MHKFCRTPSELYGIIPLDLENQIEGIWKTILSQQKEVEEEIEKGTKQDQGAASLDKGKNKDKDSIECFDVFTIDDIIGNVVSDIPNLTKDVEQLVKHQSAIETFDSDVTPVKGADKTKHPGEDEVVIEDIPCEDKPHITLVTINPPHNEPLLSEKDVEEGNPKVINSSIPPVEESEKKEIEEKEEKQKEAKKQEEEMKEIEETKESKQHKKKEDSSSGEPEDGKKIVVGTPLVKRKLHLEKESENKKAKLTIIANSEVKAEEIEEEEEEDFLIDIKKMNPKQLMKVSEKLKLQAEKAKLRAKKKKTKILNTTKTILSHLIPDIVVNDIVPIIDQLGTLGVGARS